MTFLSRILMVAATAAIAVAGATALRYTPAHAKQKLQLADAAFSPDELMDRWLDALAKNDESALHRLRVTRDEYVTILVPWTVKPGDPPRQISERPREFFWRMLDTKSQDWGREMLKRYGGKRFVRGKLAFSEAPREYAGYRAIGLVRLEARAEDGAPVTVEGPWIAEVDGRFKFIGLDWTD